ncbi:hypothetical protein TSOC_011271 [Tetrabaena socialis]|uniref:RING-type domain-containing protein n=1 Tax=Tetrabaena socialis TaxID=47790 RepID=A0A2J7ZR24_9CHLO|nr:hypothetical protein TSOC_011271 [Tetrabaena socialis]|eukprot:PNH02719.1 hypothetical protein TSOC_011271 [Tetrabaena socialis]
MCLDSIGNGQVAKPACVTKVHALEVPMEPSLHDSLLRKLDIIDFKGVRGYDCVMYIDCDILVQRSLKGILAQAAASPAGILHAAYENEDFNHPFFGFQNYTSIDERLFKRLGSTTFNDGTYIFIPNEEMLGHFRHLRRRAHARPDLREKFYDQSFYNDYFNRIGKASTKLLKDHIVIFPKDGTGYKKAALIHFAGMGNYKEKFKRIIAVIKALKGDVYGSCVRDIIQYDSHIFGRSEQPPPANTMGTIQCRLSDRSQLSTTLSILRIDYDVTSIDSLDYTEGLFRVRLKAPCSPGVVTLHVTTMVRNLWRLQRPLFDVDTLASGNASIFIYTLPTPNDATDAVSSIMVRILARRFSLIHMDMTHKRLAYTVGEAIKLVNDGWCMDDSALGSRSWLAARWADLKHPNSSHETQRPVCSDVCSICQEAFTASDVALLLPCSHAFHGFCDRKQGTGGISRWLEDNLTCPCCRQLVS